MKKATKYAIGGLFMGIITIGISVFEISKSRTFQFFGTIISEVHTDNKVAALTFDDGPAQNTDTILTILKQYNIHATFFLTGNEMASHPELTRKIIQQGHSIGNHSWSHQRMMLRSTQFIEKEVEQTDSIIRAYGFYKQIFFRPPYCKKLFYLPYYLKKTERLTMTWNIEPDSNPENARNARLIVNDVADHIKPGSIILLHAMYRDRRATMEALPGIIEYLKRNGYSIITLHEMMVQKKVTQ